MVIAKFRFFPDTKKLCMRVEGHAGHGPKGHDVVCAGASMYAFGIAQVLQNMGRDGKLETDPVINVSDGRLSISVVPKDGFFAEALHTMYVGQVGFGILAEAYPEHARLIPFDASVKDGVSK